MISSVKEEKSINKDLKYLFCGGVAGGVSRTVVAPLERLKILFQVQDIIKTPSGSGDPSKYKGIIPTLKRIGREEGFKGYFRGNGSNCLRVFPYTAIQFFVFEKMKGFLVKDGDNNLTPLARLFGGATAGIVSVCITYPLDFIRARITVQTAFAGIPNVGIFSGIFHVTKHEGPLALYRGVMPTIAGVAPYVGLNFMVYESLKARMPLDDHGKHPMLYLLICGGIAGICGQAAAYPFDLLRRRVQVAGLDGRPVLYNGNIIDGFCRIVKEEGIQGLYKGMTPNFIKAVPSIAVMFVTNEFIKGIVMDDE